MGWEGEGRGGVIDTSAGDDSRMVSSAGTSPQSVIAAAVCGIETTSEMRVKTESMNSR